MKIVVFGAGGNIGSRVVSLLLAEGHMVTAFVHSTHRFEPHPHLSIVSGDIHDSNAVEKAVAGNDAVISALGSWGTATKDILTAGMHNIIPAMQNNGIRRIISLTGAAATFPGDPPLTLASKIPRFFLGLIGGPILADSERHLELLYKSDLEWTVIRSPVMTNDTSDTDYRLSNKSPQPWERVSRDNVAKCMVAQLPDDSWHRAAPFISTSKKR